MTVRELMKKQKKMLKKMGVLDLELTPARITGSEHSMLMFLKQEGTDRSQAIKVGYRRNTDGSIKPIAERY